VDEGEKEIPMKRGIRLSRATLKYRVLLGAVAGLVVVALGAGVAVSAPPDAGFTKHKAIEVTFPPASTTTIDSTNAPHSISRKIGGQSCSNAGTDSHVVWFKWTATTGPGPIDVDTTGSSYDTVLYLFKGGKLIACNDDSIVLGIGCPVASGQPRCSLLEFSSVVGTTYYFAVAAFDDSAGGDTHLNINFE
jgi:hypothetical protein